MVQEARFAGACQDQHAGRPAPSLRWPGETKSIGARSRGKRRFSKTSLKKSRGLGPGSQGLGPRAWGRGLQGPVFHRLLEWLPRRWRPGGKQALDTGYPPTLSRLYGRKRIENLVLLKTLNPKPCIEELIANIAYAQLVSTKNYPRLLLHGLRALESRVQGLPF